LPLKYRIPGYAGNALLLLISFAVIFSDTPVVGVLLTALAILNLYLVFKLDQFSRPEGMLAHELEMTKLREDLLAAKKRVSDLETPGAAAPTPRGAGDLAKG